MIPPRGTYACAQNDPSQSIRRGTDARQHFDEITARKTVPPESTFDMNSYKEINNDWMALRDEILEEAAATVSQSQLDEDYDVQTMIPEKYKRKRFFVSDEYLDSDETRYYADLYAIGQSA
nr:hypothetical protein L204_05275 [Cryptococcus depauperatus CBS 7855]